MKRFLMLAFLTVLFSLSLQAAQNPPKVVLPAPVRVGSTILPAGDCKVTWTGSGPDVQLTLEVRGQKPVTVPARLTEVKNSQRSLQTNTVNGVEVLQKILLDKVTLDLGTGQSSGN